MIVGVVTSARQECRLRAWQYLVRIVLLAAALAFCARAVCEEVKLRRVSRQVQIAVFDDGFAEAAYTTACRSGANLRVLEQCTVLSLRARNHAVDPLTRLRWWARAEASADEATVRAPRSATAFAQLAMVESARPYREARAMKALSRSYELSRVQTEVGAWRVAFGQRNWSKLPSRLQGAVAAEARWLVERRHGGASVAGLDSIAARQVHEGGVAWLR